MAKLGFLRGALLGLMAGLLVAPRSGKEMRENIKKHYEEISDRISEELSRFKDITQETYTQVVATVVHGFVESKKITADEAAELKTELKKGFEDIRKSHQKELEAGKNINERQKMGEMIDKSKGKVKQAVGDLTGDKKLKREGESDELKGRAEGLVKDVKRTIKRAVK